MDKIKSSNQSDSKADVIPTSWDSFHDDFSFLSPGSVTTPPEGVDWAIMGIFARQETFIAPPLVYNLKTRGESFLDDLLAEGEGSIKSSAITLFRHSGYDREGDGKNYKVEMICAQALNAHITEDKSTRKSGPEWYVCHLDAKIPQEGEIVSKCGDMPKIGASPDVGFDADSFPITYPYSQYQLGNGDLAMYITWPNEHDSGLVEASLCGIGPGKALKGLNPEGKDGKEFMGGFSLSKMGRRLIDWSNIGDDLLVPSATFLTRGAAQYIAENHPGGINLFRKCIALEKGLGVYEVVDAPFVDEGKKGYAEAIKTSERRSIVLQYFLRISAVE